jgi:hypothetical protein
LRLLFRLWLLSFFLGSVVYDTYRRKKLREQERRDGITQALCHEFDAAHGFPMGQPIYARTVTAEEEVDLAKQRIDFVNTRLKEMGETWAYPDHTGRPVVSKRSILDLTDEQTEALIRELSQLIDGDRYPLSPRIRVLKDILGQLRPEPAPAAPLRRHYEPPNKGRYSRRRG